MATGQALALIALDHLDPVQVESVAGQTFVDGAMARIALASGPGEALYVNTASPEGSPPVGPCPAIGDEVSETYIVSWCEADAESVTEVMRSQPDERLQVLGFRQGHDGQTTVSVDPAADFAAAEELVRAILQDPRLRFVTTPEVIASGAELEGYVVYGAN